MRVRNKWIKGTESRRLKYIHKKTEKHRGTSRPSRMLADDTDNDIDDDDLENF